MALVRVGMFVCLNVLAISIVQPEAQAQSIRTRGRLTPQNISADDSLRKYLAEIMMKSPTIRRQCAEISAASHVAVTLRVTHLALAYSRARTILFKYESGFIRAQVDIPIGSDFVELLAHELEHVTEQIEGVDLEGLARTGSKQVSYSGDGVFETARAREAGLAAAREVHDIPQRADHGPAAPPDR